MIREKVDPHGKPLGTAGIYRVYQSAPFPGPVVFYGTYTHSTRLAGFLILYKYCLYSPKRAYIKRRRSFLLCCPQAERNLFDPAPTKPGASCILPGLRHYPSYFADPFQNFFIFLVKSKHIPPI
jgi:hypothetical protein